MNFWDDVTVQAVMNAPEGFNEFKIGENVARIKVVNETSSKSGNRMLVITFQNEEDAEINHYIVNDEYKMQKLKQLYICFNIPIGNTEIETWRDHKGIVVCKAGEPYNGKVYNKVSFLRPLTNDPKKMNYSVKVIESQQEQYNEKPPAHNAIDFIDDIPF